MGLPHYHTALDREPERTIMKTHGDDSAFAAMGDGTIMHGLTKREYFAAMAMQGMLADVTHGDDSLYLVMPVLPRAAVDYADAPIAELSKPS